MQRKIHGQMSESFLIAGILSISGGLQDAYTYMYRGKVFANAQTGNIVLLAQNLVDRNWQAVLRYFSPLLFFALGVAMAECIRMRRHKISPARQEFQNFRHFPRFKHCKPRK